MRHYSIWAGNYALVIPKQLRDHLQADRLEQDRYRRVHPRSRPHPARRMGRGRQGRRGARPGRDRTRSAGLGGRAAVVAAGGPAGGFGAVIPPWPATRAGRDVADRGVRGLRAGRRLRLHRKLRPLPLRASAAKRTKVWGKGSRQRPCPAMTRTLRPIDRCFGSCPVEPDETRRVRSPPPAGPVSPAQGMGGERMAEAAVVPGPAAGLNGWRVRAGCGACIVWECRRAGAVHGV